MSLTVSMASNLDITHYCRFFQTECFENWAFLSSGVKLERCSYSRDWDWFLLTCPVV
jgi:hypothetical protein